MGGGREAVSDCIWNLTLTCDRAGVGVRGGEVGATGWGDSDWPGGDEYGEVEDSAPSRDDGDDDAELEFLRDVDELSLLATVAEYPACPVIGEEEEAEECKCPGAEIWERAT